MSTHTPLTVATLVVTTVAVVSGALVASLAYRAANRTASRELWLLSYGLAAIALGPLAGALGAVALGLDAESTLFVQGLLVAPGFALLVRSLYPAGRPVRA
ncbi:oxidoreductase [Halosimplex rubrum]|uniref:Oxidoreductase n=1 Tax=Halosimplex rubrum TaxID=869889 RepID=A0A7D5P015_9EURY|nr:oxidoreductase [Halosimplex rubrum]QLH77277.1 oxidoreductase [Halosimplex rubrum]